MYTVNQVRDCIDLTSDKFMREMASDQFAKRNGQICWCCQLWYMGGCQPGCWSIGGEAQHVASTSHLSNHQHYTHVQPRSVIMLLPIYPSYLDITHLHTTGLRHNITFSFYFILVYFIFFNIFYLWHIFSVQEYYVAKSCYLLLCTAYVISIRCRCCRTCTGI